MSDEVAYGYTKAYWENPEEMKAGNAMLRNLNTEDPFIGLNAPLHPGAERYFEEGDRHSRPPVFLNRRPLP